MERDEYYAKIQAYKSKKLEHASNGLKGQMRDNHTYYKREGQPGNYRYYYSKEEYDAAHNKLEKVEVETTDNSNEKKGFVTKIKDKAKEEIYTIKENAVKKIEGFREKYGKTLGKGDSHFAKQYKDWDDIEEEILNKYNFKTEADVINYGVDKFFDEVEAALEAEKEKQEYAEEQWKLKEVYEKRMDKIWAEIKKLPDSEKFSFYDSIGIKDADNSSEFYEELSNIALPNGWDETIDGSEDGKIQDYGTAYCEAIITMYDYLSKAYNDWKKSNK